MNCGDNCDEYDNRADNIMLNMNENKYSGANFDNVFDPKVLEFSENCQNMENLSLPGKVDVTLNCENLRAVDQAAENINVFGENEASKIGEQIDVLNQKPLEFSGKHKF